MSGGSITNSTIDSRERGLLMIVGVIMSALIAVAYVIFISLAIWPLWQSRQALSAELNQAQTAVNDRLQAQELGLAQQRESLAAARLQLADSTELFLTEAQAAAVLDELYAYADASQITITDLQAQPITDPVDKSLYDVRVFRVQATGDISNLLTFVAMLRETAVLSAALSNLTIDEAGDLDLLSFDMSLYTSPFATGSVVADIPAPVEPQATPTARVTAVPTLERLVFELDAPWVAEDWPRVIDILTQIIALNPQYPDMREKLYAARVNYGYQLAEQGQKQLAIIQFDAAVALDPFSGEAQAALQSLNGGETATPAPGSASTYTVQRGDTLFSISRRFGVTVDAIRSANGIVGSNIAVGQVLTIPPGN